MDITTIIISVAVALLGSGVISFFVSRSNSKEKVEGGKKIGASEQKDEDRKEVSDKSDEQVKRNEEIIERNRQAIKKAREARGEKDSD